MELTFIGIDPNTDTDQSPTVWVDEIAEDLIFQSYVGDEETVASCAKTHIPGHTQGCPEEEVRWLPRRLASALTLPGNDFWLFDNRIVRFNHFTGDGASAEPEYTEDPTVAVLCTSAFQAVWERATPHADYAV